MGTIIINFYGGLLPLGVTADEPNPILIVGSGSSANSVSGELDITATPTGGLTPYTFSWSLSEDFDPNNAFSVSSTGTTNGATYNDAVFSANLPPSASDPPFSATYIATCTVTDSNGDTATVQKFISVDAVKV